MFAKPFRSAGPKDLVRISVQKSASHQLSQTELASDNPVRNTYLEIQYAETASTRHNAISGDQSANDLSIDHSFS
jgi:hypothetical protein